MHPFCTPKIISHYGFHIHTKIINRFEKNYRIVFIAFIYMISIQKFKMLFVDTEVPFTC